MSRFVRPPGPSAPVPGPASGNGDGGGGDGDGERAEYGVFGVVVRRGRHTVLDGATFPVPSGSVSMVVGGDGAGKTTLLRTLVGAIRPRSGTVRAPDRREIGFMPTGNGVWQELTVDENLEFVGAVHGVRGARFRRRRDELLAVADLGGATDRLAGKLSGGMRQKLAFCLATLHEPRLLVLDEPSTGVDPVSRVDLWRLTARMAAAGTAVAMSTSYLDEAERAASVLVLEAGQVLYRGTPERLVSGVPGTLYETVGGTELDRHVAGSGADGQGGEMHRWRRGRQFHGWHPGPSRDGERPIGADMEDAVIVAALRGPEDQA